MNAYRGKNMFMRGKIDCPIHRGDSRVEWGNQYFTEAIAELNGAINISPRR